VNAATVATTGNATIGGSATVTGNVTAGGDATVNGQLYANSWIRSTAANSGWYQQAHNGGWYMADGSWVRSYADKGVYTGGEMQAGTVRANSALYSNSQTFTYGNTYNVSDSWGFLAYNSAWGANAQPQSAIGSIYVNDGYIRSAGKWLSQMGGAESGTMCGSGWWDAGAGGVISYAPCQGYNPYYGCPAGYYPAAVFAAFSNWMYSCIKA
jgi:hypothetical protein